MNLVSKDLIANASALGRDGGVWADPDDDTRGFEPDRQRQQRRILTRREGLVVRWVHAAGADSDRDFASAGGPEHRFRAVAALPGRRNRPRSIASLWPSLSVPSSCPAAVSHGPATSAIYHSFAQAVGVLLGRSRMCLYSMKSSWTANPRMRPRPLALKPPSSNWLHDRSAVRCAGGRERQRGALAGWGPVACQRTAGNPGLRGRRGSWHVGLPPRPGLRICLQRKRA
jgi:hypothetical protein